GVVLGVASPEAAAEHAARLGGRVLVARQVEPGAEALCGVARDPDFGPLVTVGIGGAAAEALSLAAVALAPLDRPTALELVAEDDEVKVVVLTGAGRAFSAGFDISEEVDSRVEGAEQWRRILADDVELTLELWSLPKPTIAAVRGWCLAGGCDLAMACDLIVAADDARFGEPEIRYGSGPVTMLMPFLLGQKKTNELRSTGDAIDPREADLSAL